MKQNSMIKDFFMEIKKTWTRFLSVLVMVMLGVAFYAGLRATSPDMDLSADVFYDDQNLMDIRVLGTLGLTDEDVEAIAKIDGLTHVQGGYSYDVFCELPDMQPVVRLMTLYQDMNEVSLSEGRMPENASECVVDHKFLTNHGYQVGDTIHLVAENEDEITDIIQESSLTIVGAGSIPQYLSLERGTASIGNGELDSFILLLPKAFTLEAYTEICMRTEGTKSYLYTAVEYEDIIEELTEKLEDIADGRCEIRYETIVSDAEAELADAKKEIADGEQEILDAETQIADAEAELSDGENKIADGEAQIADGWDEIAVNEAKLADAKAVIDSGKQELADGEVEIEAGYEQIAAAEVELSAVQKEMDAYYAAVEELSEKKAELAENKLAIETGLQQLQAIKPQALQKIEAGLATLNAQKDAIMLKMQQPEADLPVLEEQLAQIELEMALLEQEKQELEAQETDLSEKQKRILENEKLLEENEQLLADKKPEIIAAQAQIDAGKAEIATNKELLDSKYAELNAAGQELDSGIEKYNSGMAQLSAAKQTLREKAQELADAKEEFMEKKADAQIEIADARVEIEEAKNDIKEAKKEVSDAEEELADLEVPKWYILDRNTIATYVEYDQNSQRIDAIARVFPALFFLVATLVCLTTMTRMVEENRIQIGTLKALGYSKGAIAAKYLAYAILATLLGSLLGMVVGQKLIPVVVIQAYGILYDNLPQALAPLHLQYSVSATIIALFCMIAATLFSCYKELQQPPASLMRPESPKAGKRVLLERITIIWKHLNFTNKSTIRNLFRYKKRFFMTVFGIGGCMALLLVGFGIKDSIKAIGDRQFGEIRIYDGEIVMEEELEADKKETIIETIKADERIIDYLPVYETSVDIADKNGKNAKSAYMLVPSDNEELADYIALRNRETQESFTIDKEGIIISEKLAIILDVEEGDTVLLQEDETSSVAVTGSHITENYFFHYIYMDQELYYELYHEKPEFRELYTKNADNSTSFEAELRSDYMDLQGIEEVSYITKTAEHIGTMLSTMDILIWVIVIAAGLLAYVVLYNLNNINISERKRELATLKVLGFYDMEVSSYVFRENILLTICGCFAGVFLGMALHRFVILTAEVDNMMFGREIQLHSYIYSILLTFVFSLFVNFIMHFKLKHINMVESLKSVE